MRGGSYDHNFLSSLTSGGVNTQGGSQASHAHMKKKSMHNMSNKALQPYAGSTTVPAERSDGFESSKRPSSQMSAYQKKTMSKNSMIATANKKRGSGTGVMGATFYGHHRKGESMRQSPPRGGI